MHRLFRSYGDLLEADIQSLIGLIISSFEGSRRGASERGRPRGIGLAHKALSPQNHQRNLVPDMQKLQPEGSRRGARERTIHRGIHFTRGASSYQNQLRYLACLMEDLRSRRERNHPMELGLTRSASSSNNQPSQLVKAVRGRSRKFQKAPVEAEKLKQCSFH